MRIGIDLGGTKIEVIALADGGDTLLRKRILTPQGDYTATLQAIHDLIRSVEAELKSQGTVGIGIPGAESLANGLIKNANSTCLIGRPLRADLQSLLHREIRLANDANCFALSEAIDGSGRGAQIVFGVILGTGVGGGIVVNGQVLTGANAIAGEWGHNPLPLPDASDLPLPPCYCGRNGCIETYLCGPALSRDHQQASGELLEPGEIDRRASLGDAACEATLQRYENRLGRALAGVIHPSTGDVLIDGIPVNHYWPEERADWLVYKPQEPLLFAGSHEDNVRCGNTTASADQIMQALAGAGLREAIRVGELSLAHEIAPYGSNLSGGQRQAIALARALLSPRLDGVAKVGATQRQLTFATHSPLLLNTLCDRLVVVNGGKIVADGPRQKILQG